MVKCKKFIGGIINRRCIPVIKPVSKKYIWLPRIYMYYCFSMYKRHIFFVLKLKMPYIYTCYIRIITYNFMTEHNLWKLCRNIICNCFFINTVFIYYCQVLTYTSLVQLGKTKFFYIVFICIICIRYLLLISDYISIKHRFLSRCKVIII